MRHRVATGLASGVWAGWGEAFGGNAHQSQDGQFAGYSIDSGGLVMGADRALSDAPARLGAVMSYTHGSLDDHGDRQGSGMKVDAYGLLGYGSYMGSRSYTNATAGVLFDRFDTERVIDFEGFSGIAEGKHSGTQYLAKLDGGLPFTLGSRRNTTLTPLWSVSMSRLYQSGYVESGGNGAALRVNSTHDTSLLGAVGFKLQHGFETQRGYVVPEFRASYQHEFNNGADVQNAYFAADEAATAFTIRGPHYAANSAWVSAGITVVGNRNVSLSLKYDVEIANGYVDQTGGLRLRWAF